MPALKGVEAEGAGVGFFSDRKARREAAEAQVAAEREASAREAGLTVEELAHVWRERLAASGVDTAEVQSVVDASGGRVYRPAPDIFAATTSIDRGFVLVTGSGQLVLSFRAPTSGNAAPPPVEVIVRSRTDVREPRRKEDRSFIIVFERDRLFRPPSNPMQGDAWELPHTRPDDLYRHFSSVGLPW